jgi:cytochrome P450 family 6
MSFALYELALHPEIQHRLREEILQVLSKHDGNLTYDGIHNISYMDMVVSGEELKLDIQGVHKRMVRFQRLSRN